MSLYKQLVIGICLFTIVLLCGNYVITLESSREQYSKQLSSHAQDAATALGVALTGHIHDTAMTELMVNSIFDSGYFFRIRLVDVKNGKTLYERQGEPQTADVPGWFGQLVKLQPGEGEAIIMDGWIQSARVEVISHPMFALARLWETMIASFLWLALCSAVCILGAITVLHRSLKPLNQIVEQAMAICRREFRKVPNMPQTPELRRVVEASNMMVTQLKTLFHEQAQRTELLREAAYHDSLTGLNNRRAFDSKLYALLRDEESITGQLLLLRVRDLAGLNQRIGGEKTDALLQAVANILRELQQRFLHSEAFLARNRGGEFALITQETLPAELEQLLAARLQALSDSGVSDISPGAHFTRVEFHSGDTLQQVLALADQGLAQAESNMQYSASPLNFADANKEEDHQLWRARLEEIINAENFILFSQPVFSCNNPLNILHLKVLARIKAENQEIIPAGRFMPWVYRFSLNQRMDIVMLKQTLREMVKITQPLALSISGESVATDENVNALLELLKNSPAEAGRLTLELDENELPEPERITQLVNKLNTVGCRLGIQHFGGRFNLIDNLPQWGLAWVKVDGSFIHHIDSEEDKRRFIEAMYWAARQINLPIIAERVETSGELAILNKIGLNGAMGRYFGAPTLLSEQ